MLPPGKNTTFPEYLQRMAKEQTEIYYLIVPNRTYAGMELKPSLILNSLRTIAVFRELQGEGDRSLVLLRYEIG